MNKKEEKPGKEQSHDGLGGNGSYTENNCKELDFISFVVGEPVYHPSSREQVIPVITGPSFDIWAYLYGLKRYCL